MWPFYLIHMLLEKYLCQLIKVEGPLPLDRFMQIVIKYYYSNCNSLGAQGDFITAPMVSQLFGETVAVWCLDKFLNHINDDFCLIELGAGDGTMLQDILRITDKFPSFTHHLKGIIILENSLLLKQKQAAALSQYHHKLTWIEHIDELLQHNQKNTIIIGNEFFDALPIKQFVKREGKFFEVCVALNTDNQLEYALSAKPSRIDHDCPEGGIIEISPAAQRIARLLAGLQNTCCLFIDYGYIHPSYQSTLQAVKNHCESNVLKDIGSSDITAHVDFATLADIFTEHDMQVTLATQGDFLKAYGIEPKAAKLVQMGANATGITRDLNRLIHPNQMGTLFKVLEAITPNA